MRNAILQRLMFMAITVLVGGFLSATLVRYAPGFGTDERLLDARLSSESKEAIRKEAVEERSVVHYYTVSLQRALLGDLGTSRSLQRPVSRLLAERGAVTLTLAVMGLAGAWGAAVLLVFTTWLLHSRARETAFAVAGGALLCLPSGAVALLLLLWNGPGFVALALVVFPKVYSYLGNLVKAAAGMPHILTATATGISGSRVLFWHVLPVIRREVAALAGVSLGLALSAVIPVEALGGIPGVGQLAWHAALARDLPVLLSVTLLVIACTVLANSGADLLGDNRSGPS